MFKQTILRLSAFLIYMVCGFLATCAGCNNNTTATAPTTKAPVVYFTMPVVKQVSESEEFTGRTEAVHTVEVRARVSGYLDKINFKDGAEVKQGEVLFEVDPRPYQAEFERTSALVAQAEAHVVRLDADFVRAQKLLASSSMSKEDYDKVFSDRAEAIANVRVVKAQQDTAKLNLGFTKFTSTLNGIASRRAVDPGNLVKADDTLLTTIVSMDPMYATFDVDERTVLKVRRLVREGKLQSARDTEVPVSIGLPDEDGYSVQGTINFVDNRVDTGTGTLRVRAIFTNPRKLFSPGIFIRVLLRTGPTRQATVIPDEAIGTDQGQKFIYIINDKNVVQYRKVVTGPLAPGGLRVIDQGVQTGERVLVTGLQRVKQGTAVDPKPVEALRKDKKPNDTAPVSPTGTAPVKPGKNGNV